jgi:hypothetical protein
MELRSSPSRPPCPDMCQQRGMRWMAKATRYTLLLASRGCRLGLRSSPCHKHGCCKLAVWTQAHRQSVVVTDSSSLRDAGLQLQVDTEA